ncbi:MAG: chemotaxis protein CheW [Pseudomonadales bacterium]
MTAVAVANNPEELACVLIPLCGTQLLLPQVCVAEILPWRRIKTLNGAPDWCLGVLGWRGEAVPVVRFERLNESRQEAPSVGRCLVVMNRTSEAAALPFYALAAEGLPRLVQVAGSDLAADDAKPGRAESQIVRLGAENAAIPRLNFVEQQVSRLRAGAEL